MATLTKARTIEGNIQYRDEAEDQWQLWGFAGNVRDAFDLSEADKLALRKFLNKALDRIEMSRLQPCRAWQLLCKHDRKQAASK